MPGGGPAAYLKRRLTIAIQVVERNGETVDGGIVMGRHVAAGDQVGGEDTAPGLPDRHILDADHRGKPAGE